jgi:DNA-binding MarR family transcriptional regulator
MDKRVKDDLVESVLDEKDHRIIRIILTPEGRMNKKISLPRNFPWFLNTDINVIVYLLLLLIFL